MNLYLRFFDSEILVSNVDEALDFLASIPDIKLDKDLEEDLREYVSSDLCYPKRYKVRPKVYFIVIKTEAMSMEDFKAKKALRTNVSSTRSEIPNILRLHEQKMGWYEGTLTFKRVILSITTGKCEYRDTVFAARVKAVSGLDCYNRICEHLSSRVDSRSQFPSAKGKNFQFEYLGLCK